MFIALSVMCLASNANTNAIPPIISLLLADEEELKGPVLAVGYEHSCAILRDQTVRCWGINTEGQLGNNTTINSAEPVVAIGVSGAVSIYAGFEATCATLEDGSVMCWGESGTDVFGSESNDDLLVPTQITALSDNLSMDSGQGFSCQIRPDNTVSCAGTGRDGEQGDGSTDRNSVYTAVSGISDVVELDLGRHHACAISNNGTVSCWGSNNDGETGLGSDSPSDVPTPVQVPGISAATKLALTESSSCALLENSTIQCWGRNRDGEIGSGSVNDEEFSPQTVAGISNATAITANDEHVCALLADQTVRCWGDNSRGVLNNGDATFSDQNTPQVALDLRQVTAIGAGEDYMCALSGTNSGNRKIQCVGENDENQLGVVSNLRIATPTLTTSLTNDVSSLATGGSHSCALYTNGQAACWGLNGDGQLGIGSFEYRSEPALVAGISTAVDIGAGRFSSCAVLANGTVQCWGNGSGGQLGNGSVNNSASPVSVSGITTAVKVDVGSDHACAVLDNGTVACWGENIDGALGNSAASGMSTTPVFVDDVSTAEDIFIGWRTSCVILDDGKVHCWGRGQPPTEGSAPATVVGLDNVTDMAIEFNNICAVDDGDLYCGINTNTPTKIEALSDVVSVGLAEDTICAATDNGSTQEVFCLGSNRDGLLGIGDLAAGSTSIPTKVTTLSSVDQLTHDGGHFCALTKPRTVHCWGNNRHGTVGNGTRGYSDTPNTIDLDLP